MPGPQPLPPSLRLATGRTDHTDSGGRPVVMGPDLGYATPVAPEALSDNARAFFDRIVKALEGREVLRSIDADALTAAAETYDRWRTAVDLRHEQGLTQANRFGQELKAPWISIEEQAAKQLQSWLREFGLTPSAAANLGTSGNGPPSEEDENPFNWGDED